MAVGPQLIHWIVEKRNNTQQINDIVLVQWEVLSFLRLAGRVLRQLRRPSELHLGAKR
jgi:hypothetical protein